MTAISIFNNHSFGSIRVIKDSKGEPKFCLSDVCGILGLSSKLVKQRLNDEVVSNYPISDKLGRTQVSLFVNEDGLYDTILDSRKPEAKQFRRWVTSEVLPAIRKKGGYIQEIEGESPEQLLARALMVAQDTLNRTKERNKVLEETIEANEPRVLFSKAVETSSDSILIGELAKILKQNGIEIGQNRMFEYLRSNGYLISKKCEMYNQPTQKGLDLGLFEIKKTSISKPDGTVLITTTTKITGKGQMYFTNKFLNDKI